MKRIDLLKEYYDREMNNVFSYSANWLMTIPKKGYEREFEEACIRADILKEMIEEYGRSEAEVNEEADRKNSDKFDMEG